MTSRPELTLGELEKLDIESQLRLLGEIWDSIAEANPTLPLTREEKELLDQRLAAESDTLGTPAEEVFRSLRDLLS